MKVLLCFGFRPLIPEIHQTRRVEAKQLDDGIGHTLVSINKPNEIGGVEQLRTMMLSAA